MIKKYIRINKFFQYYKQIGLRSQLLIVMLLMTLVFTGTFLYIQQKNEEKIFDLIQSQINSFSKAIEVSVEQITANGATDELRLKQYIDDLKKKGIQEISILSSDQKVIASSNPMRIGSKMSVAKDELFIEASIGEEGGKPKKVYNVIVPIIIKSGLIGYIHLTMHFEDFEKLSKQMLYKRIIITLLILSLGIILSIYISHSYTKPINSLINSVKEIANGESPQIPENARGELGELAISLQDMIERLNERKKLERELKNLQQQAMLGQLASGIAHEVRNPINLISLTIDYLNSIDLFSQTISAEDIKMHFNRIKEEIVRINHIISNFFELGKDLKLNKVNIRSDVLINEVISLVEPKFRSHKINIERDFEIPPPLVNVDIDKMKSCFLNIILNSIEAMPNGGELIIKIYSSDNRVSFEFTDSGLGISQENMFHIFDPFFTTKRHGIGLGLAIAKKIVEAHSGDIKVDSTVGKGTKITILI